MKLKFLMMPIVVIISIIIIIWHIWPTWFDKGLEDSIVSVRQNIKAEQTEINKIKQRKTNIISLNDSLQNQSENRELVLDYYPITREEENIINKINHIAFSSGVYIADLKVDYNKNNADDNFNKLLAIPKSNSAIQTSSIKTTSVAQSSTSKKNLQSAMPKMISMELKIYGNYDQIKNFLNLLYPIGSLNNIESFGIKKDAVKENDTEGNAEDKSSMLTSNIIINFGYLKKQKNEIANLLDAPLFATNNFNFDIIDEYRNMVLEKYPNSEVGETGESNPFFP